MATRAEAQGGKWVLSGEKCFITNGRRGRLVVVTVQTLAGFGAFLVPAGTPGFEAERSHDLACLRASDTSTLRFDACRLDADALLGDGRRALADAMGCLDLERVIGGAMLTAIARHAPERSGACARTPAPQP